MSPSARSTYSMIVSSLALAVALGGAGAYAAEKLPKNSVTSRQIKNGTIAAEDLDAGSVTAEKLAPGAVPNPLTDGSVTTSRLADGSVTAAKLAPGAVPNASVPDGSLTGSKLADGSITSGKVQDNSLTGADINESTLGAVPEATHAGTAGQADFAVRSQTVLAAAASSGGTLLGSQSYNVVSVQHVSTGRYLVTFGRDLSNCTYLAGATEVGAATGSTLGFYARAYAGNTSSQVQVETWNEYSGSPSALADSAFSVLVVC